MGTRQWFRFMERFHVPEGGVVGNYKSPNILEGEIEAARVILAVNNR